MGFEVRKSHEIHVAEFLPILTSIIFSIILLALVMNRREIYISHI